MPGCHKPIAKRRKLNVLQSKSITIAIITIHMSPHLLSDHQLVKHEHKSLNLALKQHVLTFQQNMVRNTCMHAHTHYNCKLCIKWHSSFIILHHAGNIEKFKNSLKIFNKELTECLNVPTLIPFLYKQNLITGDDYDILNQPFRTKQDRNRYLLQILPSKGGDAFNRFIECLKDAEEHLGHQYLAELLEKCTSLKTVV